MKTVTVLIGNSDNKLTQQEWSKYVKAVDEIIRELGTIVHFMGGPNGWAEWQNMCWVFEWEEHRIGYLKDVLWLTSRMYQQEYVAMTISDTEFI